MSCSFLAITSAIADPCCAIVTSEDPPRPRVPNLRADSQKPGQIPPKQTLRYRCGSAFPYKGSRKAARNWGIDWQNLPKLGQIGRIRVAVWESQLLKEPPDWAVGEIPVRDDPAGTGPTALLAVEDRPAEVHREADPEHEREIALLLGGDDLAVAELARLRDRAPWRSARRSRPAGDTAAAVRARARRGPGHTPVLLAVGVVVDAAAALDAEALRPRGASRRAAASIGSAGGGDRVEHAGGDVETGLVAELERAHREDRRRASPRRSPSTGVPSR